MIGSSLGVQVLLAHLGDVQREEPERRISGRGASAGQGTRRSRTAPAPARGSAAGGRPFVRSRRVASPRKRSRPAARTRSRRARRAGRSRHSNRLPQTRPGASVQAACRARAPASARARTSGYSPCQVFSRRSPIDRFARRAVDEARSAVSSSSIAATASQSAVSTAGHASNDRRTVRAAESLLQTDLQPRGQVGHPGHETARRRRLEAVGVGKQSDGEERVAQVQQRQQGILRSGQLGERLFQRPSITKPRRPRRSRSYLRLNQLRVLRDLRDFVMSVSNELRTDRNMTVCRRRRERDLRPHVRDAVVLEQCFGTRHIGTDQRPVGDHQRLVAVADVVRKQAPLG